MSKHGVSGVKDSLLWSILKGEFKGSISGLVSGLTPSPTPSKSQKVRDFGWNCPR